MHLLPRAAIAEGEREREREAHQSTPREREREKPGPSKYPDRERKREGYLIGFVFNKFLDPIYYIYKPRRVNEAQVACMEPSISINGEARGFMAPQVAWKERPY